MTNQELQQIIERLKDSLEGTPWFGRSVYQLLEEVDSTIAFKKLVPEGHAPIDILYHMVTWSEFTLKRIQKEKIDDMAAFEQLDWREIDPQIHGWDEGLAAFIATNQEIIARLQAADDSLLDQKVDYRDYDFRELLNGIREHNIYHVGQIALLKKMLS